MTKDLAAELRRVRGVVEPLCVRVPAAARALDLLERDLLPRTAGGDAYLVAGIVGPNNSGKSALFNSLVGRELSPSVPSGGATRRLVGAAHPELLASLRAEPTLARFRLRPLGKGAAAADEALRPGADPAELLVASEPGLPAALLLIDTPDFDSILEDNRNDGPIIVEVSRSHRPAGGSRVRKQHRCVQAEDQNRQNDAANRAPSLSFVHGVPPPTNYFSSAIFSIDV